MHPIKSGVIVGDKLGSLRYETIHSNNNKNDNEAIGSSVVASRSGSFCHNINGISERPVPIFCLDATSDALLVFSGAGDRYVTAWEKQDENQNWYSREKLGPHTGWVRDILYDSSRDVLHSIGCNCIETWKRSSGNGKWQHWKKSRIESSPTDGATLSSDLLCLGKFEEPYFLAGGVDGRVHLWDSDSMGTPILSFAAHQGRVNAIQRLSQNSSCILTAGNDGKIICWKYGDVDGRFQKACEFDLGESRVTCMWVTAWKGIDHVFCGTNNGEVALLSLENEPTSFQLVTIFQLASVPIVHAICVDAQEPSNVWIGHSNGLSIFSLASLTKLA